MFHDTACRWTPDILANPGHLRCRGEKPCPYAHDTTGRDKSAERVLARKGGKKGKLAPIVATDAHAETPPPTSTPAVADNTAGILKDFVDELRQQLQITRCLKEKWKTPKPK